MKNGAKYNSIEYVSSNDCSTEVVKQLLDQKGNVTVQHLKNGRTAYAITSQKKQLTSNAKYKNSEFILKKTKSINFKGNR